MINRGVLSTQAQANRDTLDRVFPMRIAGAVNHFGGANAVKGLQGIYPPELRLCASDWRVRFYDHRDWF